MTTLNTTTTTPKTYILKSTSLKDLLYQDKIDAIDKTLGQLSLEKEEIDTQIKEVAKSIHCKKALRRYYVNLLKNINNRICNQTT